MRLFRNGFALLSPGEHRPGTPRSACALLLFYVQREVYGIHGVFEFMQHEESTELHDGAEKGLKSVCLRWVRDNVVQKGRMLLTGRGDEVEESTRVT